MGHTSMQLILCFQVICLRCPSRPQWPSLVLDLWGWSFCLSSYLGGELYPNLTLTLWSLDYMGGYPCNRYTCLGLHIYWGWSFIPLRYVPFGALAAVRSGRSSWVTLSCRVPRESSDSRVPTLCEPHERGFPMCPKGGFLAGLFFKKKSPLGSISFLNNVRRYRRSAAQERLMTVLA